MVDLGQLKGSKPYFDLLIGWFFLDRCAHTESSWMYLIGFAAKSAIFDALIDCPKNLPLLVKDKKLID